jgi:DNA-binding XRE family transcriptional regulator
VLSQGSAKTVINAVGQASLRSSRPGAGAPRRGGRHGGSRGRNLSASQRKLSETLGALRVDAGRNQGELARQIAFDRTTVSHAERGTQVPSVVFWQACDDALRAHGALVRLYATWKAARQQKMDEQAAQLRSERLTRTEVLHAVASLAESPQDTRFNAGDADGPGPAGCHRAAPA